MDGHVGTIVDQTPDNALPVQAGSSMLQNLVRCSACTGTCWHCMNAHRHLSMQLLQSHPSCRLQPQDHTCSGSCTNALGKCSGQRPTGCTAMLSRMNKLLPAQPCACSALSQDSSLQSTLHVFDCCLSVYKTCMQQNMLRPICCRSENWAAKVS